MLYIRKGRRQCGDGDAPTSAASARCTMRHVWSKSGPPHRASEPHPAPALSRVGVRAPDVTHAVVVFVYLSEECLQVKECQAHCTWGMTRASVPARSEKRNIVFCSRPSHSLDSCALTLVGRVLGGVGRSPRARDGTCNKNKHRADSRPQRPPPSVGCRLLGPGLCTWFGAHAARLITRAAAWTGHPPACGERQLLCRVRRLPAAPASLRNPPAALWRERSGRGRMVAASGGALPGARVLGRPPRVGTPAEARAARRRRRPRARRMAGAAERIGTQLPGGALAHKALEGARAAGSTRRPAARRSPRPMTPPQRSRRRLRRARGPTRRPTRRAR